MPFLIEHVTEVVFTFIVAVLFGTGILIAMTIARRQRRERYFQRVDEVRARFEDVVKALLAGHIEYERGLDALKNLSGLDRMMMLEQLLVAKAPPPDQIPILRQTCADLGLVKLWQREVSGQIAAATLMSPKGILTRISRLHFVVRAKAAENLGMIRHTESWPLLVKALDDPHTDVQTVAARALAQLAQPESFPMVLERLRRVVTDPTYRLSLRTVKSAAVNFPLKHAGEMLPLLGDANGRIRFLAVDIVREMVERESAREVDFQLDRAIFLPELTELFVTKLCFDQNPDVRARSAPVLANLVDPRATPALVTLLEDPQWFVRLHAVRSLAKRKFLSQADAIGNRLTDSHWMVREAAARTLMVFGRAGLDQLTRHFLESPDRYSKEQIADEMQRAGLIPTLLAQYASQPQGSEADVFRQLAGMGKTSYMVSTLTSDSERNMRRKFLVELGGLPDPQIQGWIRQLAARETDLELRTLATQLAGEAPPQKVESPEQRRRGGA
jgi:HEAT repeat protein